MLLLSITIFQALLQKEIKKEMTARRGRQIFQVVEMDRGGGPLDQQRPFQPKRKVKYKIISSNRMYSVDSHFNIPRVSLSPAPEGYVHG